MALNRKNFTGRRAIRKSGFVLMYQAESKNYMYTVGFLETIGPIK